MIRIRGDQRCMFIGKTGSGKTFAASHLYSLFPRVIVFDGLARTKAPLITSAKSGNRMMDKSEYIFRVEDADLYSDLILSRFEEGGFITYIDELYALAKPRKATPYVINALWTRGRGNNIGAWAATQRPTWIPLEVLSECENYFIFYLRLLQDKIRVQEIIGSYTLPTRKRQFLYISDEIAEMYPELPEELKK